MSFDPILAEKRFGYGLSPKIEPPQSVQDLLAGLDAEEPMMDHFPIEDFSGFRDRMKASQALWKIRRTNRGSDAAQKAKKDLNRLKQETRHAHRRWVSLTMMRRTWTRHAFRERLVAFWADHFTAQGKVGLLKRGTSPYIEEAIRPHLTSTFADVLIAAVTSPLMVHYLDQQTSMGLNSPKAAKRGSKAGLNENLAREVLELHTLGVEAAYTQTDVRELAELLAGLTYSINKGTVFRKDFAEPGAEQVLGTAYGGDKPHIRDIHAVLRDLAVHPATARHVSRKLAMHFISDSPPSDLVATLEAQFLATGGALVPLYETLLDHPSAWDPTLHNVKLPDEFVASAFRALAVTPKLMLAKEGRDHEKQVLGLFLRPLARMGQPWQAPTGPDGWEEADSAWLTPQGLSARMEWALVGPSRILPQLPDPRVFVTKALGPQVPEPVRFAATAAEDRREAIALILSSPAFQRK